MTTTDAKGGELALAGAPQPGEIVPAGSFIALNHSPAEIGDAIRINLGGQDVTEFDLIRLSVPTGGGGAWQFETLEGPQTVTELIGIVVHAKQTRAYWEGKYKGGSEPPQCSSADGYVGVGDPGGDCRTCPLAQFGSALDDDGKPGRGQACKQLAQWFLLVENSFLPCVITVPPTSLKSTKNYMLALAGAGLRYDQVLTKLTLGKAQNQGGIAYSVVQPKLVGRLDSEAATKARGYADMLRPVFDRTTIIEGTVTAGSEES